MAPKVKCKVCGRIVAGRKTHPPHTPGEWRPWMHKSWQRDGQFLRYLWCPGRNDLGQVIQ